MNISDIRSALPDGLMRIINTLEKVGFETYITGDAVREMIMNIQPHSFELATTAQPKQIKSLFSRTIESRTNSNVVTIVERGIGYEVVSMTSTIHEELSKKDFTINAMAYSPVHGFIDNHDGIGDTKKKVIRCVGEPSRRFREDPVRMLKAVRLSAVLGFDITGDAMRNIRKYGILSKKMNAERVREELNKILMSERPSKIRVLRDVGILKYILPELDICFSVKQQNKYHIYDVGNHILAALDNTPCDLVLRWSALLHDIGKPCCQSVDNVGIIHFYGHHKESVRIAGGIMHRLHFDDNLIHDISLLVENHDVRIEAAPITVKRMLARTGEELFEKLLLLQEADSRGKNPKYIDEKLQKLKFVYSIYKNIIEEHQPYTLNHLVVNSRDLIKCGYKAGREIGDTLHLLLEEVLINPELNTREYLMSRVKEMRNKRGKRY